jgi:Nuclear pore protein 84 / 107
MIRFWVGVSLSLVVTRSLSLSLFVVFFDVRSPFLFSFSSSSCFLSLSWFACFNCLLLLLFFAVGEGSELEGNPTRDIWRTACFSLSEHSPSVYERAVYGSLCGNLRQVLPVCGTRFHDHLWAYLTAYIVSRIHSLLAMHPHPDVSSIALEGGLLTEESEAAELRQGDMAMTPWQILTHLTEGGASPEVVQDGSRPYHLIQAMLLSGCGSELVDRLRQWAEEDHQTETSAEAMLHTPPPVSKRMTPRLLRLAVHVGLFLYENHSPVPVPPSSVAADRAEDRRRIEEPLSVLLLCYIRHLVHNNQVCRCVV